MTTAILPTDLGSFKPAAGSREGGASSFRTIHSTMPELTGLIPRLPPAVVIEPCVLEVGRVDPDGRGAGALFFPSSPDLG